MKTYIVYFDETGDDGVTSASSDHFILTGLYMPAEEWQNNYDLIQNMRKKMKNDYGFHTSQEMHAKHFLTDKKPFRDYGWSKEIKQQILSDFSLVIAAMDVKIINVIIDKTKFRDKNYRVLENALKYNIQRIENDSNGEWNYLIITDKGRLAPMRKTARAIRAFNPIHSKFGYGYTNQPISNLIEDILEKDSKESYFIQMADYISYFVHLYFDCIQNNRTLPNRVQNVIDKEFVRNIMLELKKKINLKANMQNEFGLVIYPK